MIELDYVQLPTRQLQTVTRFLSHSATVAWV